MKKPLTNGHDPAGERRRICMVSTHGYVAATPPLGAADTGGQVVYVLELSKKLASLGYAVDIWTRQFEDQPAIEKVADHVRIRRVPCGGPEFIPKEYLCDHLDDWIAGALSSIEAEKLDYEFVNSHYWDAGIAGRRLAEALRIPHVHTPHSLGIWKKREMERDSGDDPATFERKYNFSQRIESERDVMRTAALVVATTPIHIDIMAEVYGVDRDRIVMIPPGYDDLRFYPVSDAERESIRRRIRFDGQAVLALGRMASNKGYDLLVRAFATVARKMPDARLYLSAGGSLVSDEEQQMRRELDRMVEELELSGRVDFLPFIPDEELVDYYRAADLFVLCSRYEPFGMTTIEAMACGTPAVVTTHGGLWQELEFGVDAIFADPFDPDELAVAISQALSYDDLRERLREQAIRKVRSCYTWGNIAQQLLGEVGARSTSQGEPRESRPAHVTDGSLRVVA